MQMVMFYITAFMVTMVAFCKAVPGRFLRTKETYHTEKKTWNDARNTCQQEGGDLAMVIYPSINDKLAEQKEVLWIGATDAEKENTFVWVNGRPVNEAFDKLWNEGQPDDADLGGQDCVTINWNEQGKWDDSNCEKKNAFACQTVDEYSVFKEKKTWDDARKTCQDKGGDLAMLDCPRVVYWLSEQRETHWIGASDAEKKGTLAWLDGTPVTPKENRNGENPDVADLGGTDCLAINPNLPEKYDLLNCKEKRAFACRYDYWANKRRI